MRKTRLSDSVLPWTVPIVALILWFIVTNGPSQNETSLIPTPQATGEAFIRLLLDGTLIKNIEISSFRAFGGLFVGGLIGFFLGVLNGQFHTAEKLLNTPIQMIRNVPHLAMMPLILIWFGIGETAKLVLISLGVFFPIYLNTFQGIRFIDGGLLEMGKTYGLNRLMLFKDIILPGAMPSIMIGVKQSLGRMWLTLIIAEMVAAKSGLGFMAMNAREYMMMDVVVLSMIIYAILGSLSDVVAVKIEKSVLKWHPNYRNSN